MHSTHNNFDPNERAKFDAMADDWWNPFGKCKPLHAINPLRMTFMQSHVSLNAKRVLDVGCGGGILSEDLAKAGAIVTAIDVAEEALNVAKNHAKQENLAIRYELSTAEEWAQAHESEFDVITCMEILEHVPNPASLVEACARLVKPNGHVFFSTINRNVKAFLHAIIGAEYLLKLLPIGTHEYAKFISPAELDGFLQQSNLQLRAMTGITYSPLWQQYRLTQDVSVNYLVYASPS